MPELLLELFSEEIPARMQARAAEDLARLVCDGLKAEGLAFGKVEKFVSPRRLGLAVAGVPAARADLREEKRGPRVGAPEQAIQGFLKSVGFAAIDRCEKRAVKGVEYYFAAVETKGGATVAALPAIVGAAIRGLAWPKSMRWAATTFAYVRPLHNILCRFDGKVVTGSFDCGGATVLPFTGTTFGHRFLAPSAIEIASADEYRAKLRDASVIADTAERRATIWEKAQATAKARGLAVKQDDALLDEVTGLVEWPVPLIGRIDDGSMALPQEVLVTSMRNNQKYFALETKDGAMAPFFLTVANMETKDGGVAIVAGNERVLRARLADARFFWDQDRKTKLESRVAALNSITWHAKLGTIGDKVGRIEALAVEIAKRIPGAEEGKVRLAARLAKADLTTGMVGEFPELQGVMGRYYALHDGEDKEVAAAIAEHWGPLGPSDKCPSAPVSVAVALADKIDSLVWFFSIGEKPTGSKDPYALRRAALGVVRLIVDNNVRLRLANLVDSYLASRVAHFFLNWQAPTPDRSASELLAFFADRLKVALREKGVRHDLVDAVFALGGEDDLVRLLARVEALRGFIESEDGKNLLIAYKRAANIVRIEAKKPDQLEWFGKAPDSALFKQPEEQALAAALDRVAGESGGLIAKEDFTGAMRALAALRRPVDVFFDKVTVNAPEAALRANRLRLLQHIGEVMDRIAIFAKIEG